MFGGKKASASTSIAHSAAELPEDSIWQNKSFMAMAATQFLGAFNDNLFKQMVLLACLQLALREAGQDRFQWVANFAFSLPFVLLSGFAGFLSDRFSKQAISVLCKWAELGIMVLAIFIFMLMREPKPDQLFPAMGLERGIWLSMLLLLLMGTHSAFFGPSKYGILPELVPSHQLPMANSIFLATTFLAIILGVSGAGVVSQLMGEHRWIGGIACCVVSMLGIYCSRQVWPTPPVKPDLQFRPEDLFISSETFSALSRDRELFWAVIVYSLFWFVGGVVLPTVNAVGKVQMGLSEFTTSLMTASVAVGIGLGSLAAGVVSRVRPVFSLVQVGCLGIIVTLLMLMIPGRAVAPEGFPRQVGSAIGFGGMILVCTALGVFSGLFAVPLQVFLQGRPSPEIKGRVIGAMNFVNWIFILIAALFYGGSELVAQKMLLPPSWIFGFVVPPMLLSLMFYRPPKSLTRNP